MKKKSQGIYSSQAQGGGGGGGSIDRLSPEWFTGFFECPMIGQISFLDFVVAFQRQQLAHLF